MSSHDIIALEWALSNLAHLNDSDQYAQLMELYQEQAAEVRVFEGATPSLIHLMAKYGRTIPQREFHSWRMVPLRDQRPGMISALPESRGILRATNGIICWIEQDNGTIRGRLYEGHVQHWQPDPSESEPNRTVIRKGRQSAEDKLLESVFNALQVA